MQSIGQVLLDKIRHNFVKYQVTKFSWDSTETVGGGGGLMVYMHRSVYLFWTRYYLKNKIYCIEEIILKSFSRIKLQAS